METGEVQLKVGAHTYRLVMKTAGLMRFQKHFSTPQQIADLDDLLSKVNAGSLEHIVPFVWASLLKYQPDFTLEDTFSLIDEAGGIAGLGAQLLTLGLSTVPDTADIEELSRGSKKKTNPRKARAARTGTGGNSTSAPEVLA